MAGSTSLVGSSAVALVGDGAAAVPGALGGELVPSSTIAVALQKFPG